MPDELTPIGWREWVALPELGIAWLKAKVDTGARTSALHAWDVEIDESTEPATVRFSVHPIQRDDDLVIECAAPLLEWRQIRSSNGELDDRPVVTTTVTAVGRSFPAELTLTRRDEMGFRMLLGREALRARFVVDPGASYLGGRPPRNARPRPA